MTRKDIIRYNRKIAEFLGAQSEGLKYDLYSCIALNDIFDGIDANDPYEKHYYLPIEMKFHESWDWLMPVVRNCLDAKHDTDDLSKICDEIIDAIEAVSLFDTYIRVNDFIHAFNEEVEARKEPAWLKNYLCEESDVCEAASIASIITQNMFEELSESMIDRYYSIGELAYQVFKKQLIIENNDNFKGEWSKYLDEEEPDTTDWESWVLKQARKLLRK